MINGNKTYVLYHVNCTDGAGARFAAWKKFRDHATYIPVQYNEPLPDMEDGSDVYILDFSYPREVLLALNERMRLLMVLDHHDTAEKDLKDLPFAQFDMSKSGAVMAWEYFHPTRPVPQLLLHVQDRDLWKFRLPGSREIHAGMAHHRDQMEAWERIVAESYGPDKTGGPLMMEILNHGKSLLDYEDAIIKNSIRTMAKVKFWGHTVAVVNATALRDEIAEAIYMNPKYLVDFVITFRVDAKSNTVFLSFRSQKVPNGIIVNRMTKKLGTILNTSGGGHEHASGVAVGLKELDDLLSGRMEVEPK